MKDFIHQDESEVLSEKRVAANINQIASLATLTSASIFLDFRSHIDFEDAIDWFADIA